MTYSPSNNCTKNYYNRTLTVQVIIEDVVTWIFLKHSVVDEYLASDIDDIKFLLRVCEVRYARETSPLLPKTRTCFKL